MKEFPSRFRVCRWLALLGCCLAAAVAPRLEADEPPKAVDGRIVQRFDFDSEALAKKWTAAGAIQASRRVLPEPAPKLAKEDAAPKSHAVSLTAAGAGMFYTKAKIVAGDWAAAEEIAFWLHMPKDVENCVIEVRLIESDARARFWRKVDIDHRGWKEVRLPLKWFRESSGRVPQWSKVAHLGFYFRGKGELAIDTIRVTDADPKSGARMTVDDLLPWAFPDAAKDKVRVHRGLRAVIATNEPALDTDALAAHLEKVADAIDHDFGFLPKSTLPGVLFVFATANEYRAFVPRMAQRLGAETARPASDGFTMQGIATSYWDPGKGHLRPVYCHEFIHSYLAPRLLLSNQGEWLQEGIAAWYQLKFHPQDDFSELVRGQLARERGVLPMGTLANGEKIATGAYWQAATMVGVLLGQPQYRDRFPALIQAFNERSSTNIAPHWDKLGAAEETFDKDWRAFLADKYLRDTK